MAKKTKKQFKSNLKLEALEQRQLLAGGFTADQGQEFSNISHPNGNVYDQVLLKSSSINVINDPGQITRVSFLDTQGDIVQVEFGGAGTLNVSLDGTTFQSGVAPTNYNQSGVLYVQGHASITISGSDASTSLNVFSVGSLTAVNQGLFDATHTGGNNTADIQRVTIVANPGNPNGSTFGSIFAGNVNFTGSSGPVGISAANVHVQNLVRIGDITATGSATPTLIFGQFSQFGSLTVAGGDLVGPTINNTNSYDFALNFTAGASSNNVITPANIPLSLSFTEDNPLAKINQTLTLTTGVDTLTGGAGHDTFVGTLNDDSPTTATLTTLDTLNGGAGTNTLNITDLDSTGGSAQPGGLTISNIATINIRAVDDTTFNASTGTFSGVTALNVTQAVDATLTGAATTAISTAGTTGAVSINGGSSVTVNTAGAGVTIGATTATTGAISVTHTKQGTSGITIGGGSTVGVTASDASTGTVDIGVGAATDPTGAVTVTTTGAAYDATVVGDVTRGAITIVAGTTATVNQTATSSSSAAATDTSAESIIQSNVTITGTDATTTVSVTQTAAQGETNAAAGSATTTKETNALTFGALTTGQTTIIGGLKFTATKNLTAAEVAAAFANLGNSAVQGTGGTGNGIYDGTLSGVWSSGAASGAVVTFTAKDGGPDADADLDVTAGVVDPTVVVTAGTSTAGAVAGGKPGIVGGAVVVGDGGTGSDSLATVTLTGYGAGSSVASEALTSLTLASSAKDIAVTNASTGMTLALGVNAITGGADVNVGTAYTTVNLNATGAASDVDLLAANATTLNVSGDKVVTLTGSTLSALTTLTVAGSAGIVMDNGQIGTLTSINASGTSGAVTAFTDGTKATYSGSSGVDTLTVSGASLDKATSLGAGNDVVTVTTASSFTANLDGGDGTDTLVMTGANLATASATTTFETFISGIEKVKLSDTVAATTTRTINLANLDDINYVITGGLAAADSVLNVTNMASGGTLEIGAAANAAAVTSVVLTDAGGASDVLNVVLGANAGKVSLAGIETVNLSVSGSSRTITLQANDATSLVVSGSGSTTITIDNAVTDSITLINGSAATGAITVTGGTTIAQEIRGGTAADALTAGHNNDVLNGNAGNDTLSTGGKSLVAMTGGAGNDTFDISGTAVSNVNSYGTITDLAAGDKVKFNDANAFAAAAITLGDTAVFQDYANAAIANTDAGNVTWFQFGGNTYVVQHMSGDAATDFVNGTDTIVKINGAVNLATSSFSTSAETLLIV